MGAEFAKYLKLIIVSLSKTDITFLKGTSMKYGLLVLLFTLFLQTPVKSEDNTKQIFLGQCINSGSGVSFSFLSCVNRNFSSIASTTRGFYSYCSNIGDEVSFSFTSCIQRNFQSVERDASGGLYLSYCFNSTRDQLGFSYVSCVNRNFRAIESFINSGRGQF